MANLSKKTLRVVLGISGGVDSSVAGFILKKQGYNVHGVFMRNWNILDEVGVCSIDKDVEDAAKSCSKLGIQFHEVNFSKEYWNEVFTDLIDQYEHGLTPNPDVMCNRHIKFDKLMKYSIERLGADAVATGHYAQTSFGTFLDLKNKSVGVNLLKAKDNFKDQTFFLSQILQESLQNVMFPIGPLLKSEVKQIALEQNLNHVLMKKESTGICFIGKRKFTDFISDYIPDQPGVFVDFDSGKVIGSHRGIHHFTIGQRCRLGGSVERMYVAKKCPKTQEIIVVPGRNHPMLWGKYMTTSKPHWIHSVPAVLNNGGVLKCDFRFQHTNPLVPCLVMLDINQHLIIILQRPLFALTPGQYAVLYKDNICLGGAKIVNTAPNQYSLTLGS